MAKRPAPVAQADVTRALKGVLAAGMPLERITGVRATKDGVEILFGEPGRAENASLNEWDEASR
ncbi:hypothetical protein ABIE65_004981 [Constrictibacter sp. MBR-5]|jgi:hypothetical protein|uniref:hypothetical protein n=1 Tax=Constrictibacter sp. MBR-5 TaxID=3156467 RepID=UPI00339AD2FE